MIISELYQITFLQEKIHNDVTEFHRQCVMVNVIMEYCLKYRHMKIKRPKSILMKKKLIESECNTPYSCLIFIFYQKYFL